MITFVQPPLNCDIEHIRLWDEFLTLMLDEKSRKLILRAGIKYVLDEVRKGTGGRYAIAQGGLYVRD